MMRLPFFLLTLGLGASVGVAACGSSGTTCEGEACAAQCTGPGCDPATDGGGDGSTGPIDGGSAPLSCPIAKVEVAGASGELGAAVAIDGVTAAVGAPSAALTDGGLASGVVHVLGRDGCAWKSVGVASSSNLSRGARFGGRVALAADTLLVGAPSANDFSSVGSTVTTLYSVGKAFVATVPKGGVPAAFTMVWGGKRDSDRAGSGVALSADAQRAVVGVPGADYMPGGIQVDNTGEGFVLGRASGATTYTAGGGLYIGDLGGAGASAGVGASVALVGDDVVTGAPGFDTGKGQAFVYDRPPDAGSWRRRAALVPSKVVAGSRFGEAIASSGDTLVVGAPAFAEGAAKKTGAAFVFVRDAGGAYKEVQAIAPTDAVDNDEFGTSIALAGDLLLIGAPGPVLSGATKGGSVYVFTKSATGWTQKSKITAPGSPTADSFGASVALSGGVALVGAPNTDAGRGAIYSFTPGP